MSAPRLATLASCCGVVGVVASIGCSAGSSAEARPGGAAGFGAASYGAGGAPASGGSAPASGGTGVGATTGAAASTGAGGSAGSVGAGGAGVVGTASGVVSKYDPGVVFDWPESTGGPGSANQCKAGHYVGTFECKYLPAGAADSGAGFVVSGPIDMHLDQGTSGEFLTVSGGKLTGAAVLAVVFNADVVGQLDCTSGKFVGSLQNGAYNFFIFPGGTFAGPFNGKSSSGATPSLTGTWQLQTSGATTTGSCNGTWTAAWQAT